MFMSCFLSIRSLVSGAAVLLTLTALHGKEAPSKVSGESAAEIREAERRLQPGDHIFIHVLEQSEQPARQLIREDGTLAYYGRQPLPLSGLTCLQAATLIARQMSKKWPFSELGGPIVRVTRAGPLPSMQDLDASVLLKKGDSLIIQFVDSRTGIREESDRVCEDGRLISLPYSHQVQVQAATGLTCRSLAYNIQNALEKQGSPKVTVLVRKPPPPPKIFGCPVEQPIFLVMGNVMREGKQLFLLGQDLRVSEAIRMAGGIRPGKKAKKIQIIRKTPMGNKRILVHPLAALGLGKQDYDVYLRRDDVVLVE